MNSNERKKEMTLCHPDTEYVFLVIVAYPNVASFSPTISWDWPLEKSKEDL